MLGINRKTTPESIARAKKEVDQTQALINRAGGILPYMAGAAAYTTNKEPMKERKTTWKT